MLIPPRARGPWKLLTTIAVMLPIAVVVGWGYWQTVTHADVWILVHDVALRNDRQFYGDVRAGDLVFVDATGRALATGAIDGGIVRLRHPEVGDCRAEERAGQTAFQECIAARRVTRS